MNTPARERWHVARTQPGKWRIGELHLRRQGYKAFVPQIETTVRRRQRFHLRRVPFFPGYLFVFFNTANTRWRAINSTRGISTLIMQGETPLPLPIGVVESLIARTDELGILRPEEKIAPGSSVLISTGPFANLAGTLQKLEPNGRCRVLVELLNGSVAVRLERGSIRLQD
ncbi:hypothetical protein ICI42_02285 [Tianweitania sp. Rool2]|uniref:NusG-like N-terminal domain-containing protein n=1 Tax=Oryzicola mucosus TaxID=2767425 RepID=A0A8J6TXP9_9HYPH|nr:hypothetical protein [Oryzicola mucosus]